MKSVIGLLLIVMLVTVRDAGYMASHSSITGLAEIPELNGQIPMQRRQDSALLLKARTPIEQEFSEFIRAGVGL